MKLHLLIPLVLLSIVSCSEKGPTPDEVQILAAFTQYKDAILSTDGKRAADLVTTRTIDEYQQYMDWARSANRETLESLSTINKMQVLIIRLRVPKDLIPTMDGYSAFRYAVDNDWVGKEQTIQTSIDDIQVSGHRATAGIKIGDQRAPTRFHFTKEKNTWRFDLIQTIIDTNLALKAQIRQSGMTETEFLVVILESVAGVKVTEEIWNPRE